MRRQRTIIALGGGGFSPAKPDRALCTYILRHARRATPRVCFLATAVGDSERLLKAFYRTADGLGAKPSHLSLFDQPRRPFNRFVAGHDVVYVCGGNTRNLLILWKAWGLDRVLWDAYERGIVLAGHSAGALCWFRGGVTDSYPGRLTALRCLGFLRGSFCPHYDSEPRRRPVYRTLVRNGRLPGGYAADDHVGLHFADGRLMQIVSSRKDARAHRVRRVNGRLVETPLEPVVLV
jgi:dipeptidase E